MSKNPSGAAPPPHVFEPEFIDGVREIFERRILFNALLGLQITAISPEQVTAQIAMRPDLIGHFAHNRIHGGVISAGLDAMGGLAVPLALSVSNSSSPQRVMSSSTS